MLIYLTSDLTFWTILEPVQAIVVIAINNRMERLSHLKPIVTFRSQPTKLVPIIYGISPISKGAWIRGANLSIRQMRFISNESEDQHNNQNTSTPKINDEKVRNKTNYNHHTPSYKTPNDTFLNRYQFHDNFENNKNKSQYDADITASSLSPRSREQSDIISKGGGSGGAARGNSTFAKTSQEKPNIPVPRELKRYLDRYVVGQYKAKKIMSVAVYNHYIRVNDMIQRQEKKIEQFTQSDMEDYYTDSRQADVIYKNDVEVSRSRTKESFAKDWNTADEENTPVLEKSNVLLLGPSGTGKTLIAQTLAKVLGVPISISDCTSLTQAGYIGDDVEVCIQRLLQAADYNVELAERGIIVLDEVDKLARKVSVRDGRDVSGEGVQQSLLKIIEGSLVQVTAKSETRAVGSGLFTLNSSNSRNRPPAKSIEKNEVFGVNTSNILFIFTGAFVGLDKIVSERVSKGGIGFDAFISDNNDKESIGANSVSQIKLKNGKKVSALDIVTPADLMKYGMIPELVGRIPIISGLSALSKEELVRILTEPQNAILKQYEHAFKSFGVRLAFTRKAIESIAELSMKEGTGARGLRGIIERLLLDVNFDCPGSGIQFVMIDSKAVRHMDQTYNEEGSKDDDHHSNINYYSRGERYKFIDDVSKEDPELAKLLEREFGPGGASHNNMKNTQGASAAG